MADVELRTLGECQVIVRGERIGPQSPHAFALSLYLCIERGRPHPREALLSLFFPDADIDKGRHSLRQSLYKLRQLGMPCDTTTAGTIVPTSAVRDDFTSLLAAAELPDLPAGRLPGAFLPGYWPKISLEYTRWLEAQRDAVNSALRRAYIARIADRRSVARWDQVERYARACLEVDPLNEEATLALAEALALSGSKAAGVKVLDDYLVEVGSSGAPLTLPAATLRRRISERVPGRRDAHDIPLIGRDGEMRMLADAAAQARSGVQATLWLHGEPGIGKSRLLREFSKQMCLSGVSIVTVSSQLPNMPQSLSTVSEAVTALLELPGALGASADTLRVLRSACPSHDRSAEQGTWNGVTTDSPAHLALSFCDLVDAVCSEQAVILAFDDFHWADELSRVLVSALCKGSTSRRLMLLLLSREAPRSHAIGSVHTVTLPGLRRVDAAEMLRTAFARTSTIVPHDIVQRALDLGSGNPFFLNALVDHFISNPGTTEIPKRLVELIRQRVASVAPIAGLILRSCALLGRHASLDRIRLLLEVPRHDLARGLTELEAAGLITWDAGSISVSHALIAEFVLGDRASASSALLDSAAAEVLEREAQEAGSISLYWSAHACWKQADNKGAAARCASEAATLSDLSAIVRFVDWAVPRNTWEHESRAATPGFRDTRAIRDSVVLPHSTIPATGRPLNDLDLEDPRSALTTPKRKDILHLIQYAQNGANSTAARLRAAVAALALSEDNGDADLALAAYEAALSAGDNTTGNAQADRERAILAYHTFFGDRSVAAELIGTIERSLYSRPDLFAALRSAQNAAEAACHSGDIERGLRLFENVHGLAVSAGLRDHAADVSVHATWFARQIADNASVALWTARAEDMLTVDTPIHSSHAYNQALLAFDASDLQRLHHFERIVASAVPGAKRYRLTALIDSLAVMRLVCVEQTTPDSVTTCRLREWSLKTAPFQPSDDAAVSVWLALSAADSAGAASAFVRKYLSLRRADTYQCLPYLTELSAKLALLD